MKSTISHHGQNKNLPVGNEALSRRKVRTGTQLAATGTIKTFQPFKK